MLWLASPLRALLVVTLGLVAAAVGGVDEAQAQFGPPAVGVVKAERVPVTESDEFVGRVQAIGRVALVARVTAFLEQRLFTEGSEVKRGDLLYRLEQPPFAADVQSKQATVAQANALLANATITFGRAQSLLNTPAGQRSTVDDATASQRSFSARYSAMRPSFSPIASSPHQTTSPAAISVSRSAERYPYSRAGSTSVSSIDAGMGAPCRFSITSSSASSPRRGCTTPCQRVNSRASVACSTGSTSLRSFASDRRRIVRSTSWSHHSRCVPPGRNPPSTTRPLCTSRFSTASAVSVASPNRLATSPVVNGPCVRP